ncbi:hypothetical protein I601_2782 [Nocardioides dokdonensis FR1436]|uniref:Aminoglycoside phosphotransferase domain-containing protein n=1 Tax=Nocardioides dokdonensis FR1436 TaxID=1300347 RepID=A0A1A9GLP9_9ACTN|nr:phosphotransferase [Nocardioides dokdonensis]ANH39198.1 hypothetical protein I601_2782 [Nocardioides dokdonensis FR1436]
MHEQPEHVSDTEVLATVRAHWSAEVDAVTHLPMGSGGHHWQATSRGAPRLFVTLDRLGARHDATSLEGAYAGAAALAFAVDAVVAGLPTLAGRYTVPLADGALSVTPWVWGERAGDGPPATRADAEATARTLRRLHAARPAAGVPAWAQLVPASFASDLAEQLAPTWSTGPMAAPAQDLLRAHVTDVEAWTERYHTLAATARDRAWVATHGEPHSRNQLRSLTGRLLLVDWESLRVAPPERDLRILVDAGHADLVDADPLMLELFDLEWRLDEIDQLAARFAPAHTGDRDDVEALTALRFALTRPGAAYDT